MASLYLIFSLKQAKYVGEIPDMRAAILLAVMAAAAARPDEGFYETKYENFNVKEVVSNLRLLKSYAKCFLETGKCTPEGNYFKKLVPEAIETNCSRCRENHKGLIAEFVKAIKEKLPTEFEGLMDSYNSDKKYTESLNMFLEKYAPH